MSRDSNWDILSSNQVSYCLMNTVLFLRWEPCVAPRIPCGTKFMTSPSLSRLPSRRNFAFGRAISVLGSFHIWRSIFGGFLTPSHPLSAKCMCRLTVNLGYCLTPPPSVRTSSMEAPLGPLPLSHEWCHASRSPGPTQPCFCRHYVLK